MPALLRPWGALHYRIDGKADGPTVVFANSLGTDLHLWDEVVARLPDMRAIRFDKSGHGLSDLCPTPGMEDYVGDAAALMEAEAKGPVVFVGLSIGGMIAQALAARRPDLVRGLVLSNTAPRMGTAESWAARIEAVRHAGTASIADAVMERWFAPVFHGRPELALWRNMLARSDDAGYIAACEVLAATDLAESTARLDLPVMVLAGAQDGASPPDLVAALARTIRGAQLHVLPDVGHLPPVEAPEAMAQLLRDFVGALPA